MDAGDGHDLIQQTLLLAAARTQVPLALHRGVLPKSGSRSVNRRDP
jgi:hypothetical protein